MLVRQARVPPAKAHTERPSGPGLVHRSEPGRQRPNWSVNDRSGLSSSPSSDAGSRPLVPVSCPTPALLSQVDEAETVIWCFQHVQCHGSTVPRAIRVAGGQPVPIATHARGTALERAGQGIADVGASRQAVAPLVRAGRTARAAAVSERYLDVSVALKDRREGNSQCRSRGRCEHGKRVGRLSSEDASESRPSRQECPPMPDHKPARTFPE